MDDDINILRVRSYSNDSDSQEGGGSDSSSSSGGSSRDSNTPVDPSAAASALIPKADEASTSTAEDPKW